MKKIFAAAFAAFLAFGAVSCNKDILPEGADNMTTRCGLAPEPSTLSAAGETFEAVVVVAKGVSLNVGWTASVDGNPSWVELRETTLKTHFEGTYAGDDRELEQKGISCTVSANTSGKKRTAVLRFTTVQGTSATYIITQAAK